MIYPDSEFFLNYQKGDTFLALDAPFSSNIAENDSTVRDTKDGIKLVYLLKFQIEEKRGMHFIRAGAAFEQFLDTSAHFTLVTICSAIMSPRMANFGAEMAHEQSQGSHAPPAKAAGSHPPPAMAFTGNPWEAITDQP